MTTLDDQLYRWLCEADDRQFTLAFNSYFLLAYPAVIRHLVRLAPSDPALLEEIAQDSLLKFFERIGRGRRAASAAVADALRQIKPISLGSVHQCQVRAWTTEVDSYRRVTMSFRLPRAGSDEAATWRDAIRELTLQIPILQQQGWHLIDGICIELQWQEVGDEAAAANLASAIMESAPSAHSAELRLPGTLQFVHCAVTMIHAVPRLRVPTNGYLFEIARSLYLDDYRRRRRHKRGGADSPAHDAVRADSDGEPFEHPLESQLDHDLDDVSHPDVAAAAGWPSRRLRANVECASTDPIRTLEDEEYFERFYAYLRAPVDAAESAYEAARARGGSLAERRKWESLVQKFSRTMAVLTAIGEGYTQEQAAERLQLSRNKVKYVIETLQDAYLRFAAGSAGSSHPLPAGGVPPHAS
jgi:DNA-directed RNA polymerase specialized sigma24 family protein